MSEKINIGWIGLGNMGTPMVKNLVKAGFDVTVYNRSSDKTEALSNEIKISVANSPAELVATSDVIITMLADDAAVKVVYESENGILSAVADKNPTAVDEQPTIGDKKLTVVDMSTVSPETTIYLAGLCAEKGISYLDAPVAGSVKPAEEAQLVIMVGGDESVYHYVKPAFDALGKASIYLGENGKANVAKLSVNLMLGIATQALAEAVIFARKNGLSAELLLPIINASAVGGGMTKMKTENIINDNFKPAFALDLLKKDLRLATENGMDTPAGKSVYQTLQAASDKGYGDEDMIAVLKYLSENK